MIPGGDKYIWLVWSLAFLIPWGMLYAAVPGQRCVMWWSSSLTALFGLTEPLFVPEYWNPPGLFDLAQRTGFDIESLIFCFGIGGVGAVLYNALTRKRLMPMASNERHSPIEGVWNLPALSGVMIGAFPIEEILFGFGVGAYWSGVYEHLAWHRSN